MAGPLPIATYEDGTVDEMAELIGILDLAEPCIYVTDSTNRRYLLIVPNDTSSWQSGELELTIMSTTFSNSDEVSISGSGDEDRLDVPLVRSNIKVSPSDACDTTNIWFANGIGKTRT